MNIFTQYGIKEVADVMIYSITKIGDEEVYLPVLYLDTLKISNIEKKEQKVAASSGYGNAKVISWSFGKDITLKMQDALFTPASLSMCWGGWLSNEMKPLVSAISKIIVRNKYVAKNYSIYAYPSPKLTPEEWEEIYDMDDTFNTWVLGVYKKGVAFKEEDRMLLKKSYYRQYDEDNFTDSDVNRHETFWRKIPGRIALNINSHNTDIKSKIHNSEFVLRSEKCVVQDKELIIDGSLQRKNYVRYLSKDLSGAYVLFLDSKTMKPLFGDGWRDFALKPGTEYIKITSEQYVSQDLTNSSYGKVLTISSDTFPNYYRIVGETNIRDQITGLDKRLQFIIPKVKLSGDTNIKLEATGDPTVFDMNVDVICPENDVMFILKEFEVEDDCNYGGTHIVPQAAKFGTTNYYNPEDIGVINPTSDNDEIY